jgi:hypothetical protein
VTLKEVTTTRLAKDAFNKGLVAVNGKSKKVKEASDPIGHSRMTYDVISKDPPITDQFITGKFLDIRTVRSNRFNPERLDTGDNDAGKDYGLQRERKTVPHGRYHVQFQQLVS